MRRSFVPLAIAITLLFSVSSPISGPAPRAVVTTKFGKTFVLKGAHCFNGRLNFGAWPYSRGKAMRIVLDPFRPGHADVSDRFIDLRPSGAHVALSGTAHVNRDGRSGRFVWGRGGRLSTPTGHRYTGAWRCA